MNCKIHPVLYKYYLVLHKQFGAEIVHRRNRRSNTSIEIIFNRECLTDISGCINSLNEAEVDGYIVVCRRQTKRGHTFYNGRRVYQLFITPVHPRKYRPYQLVLKASRMTTCNISAAVGRSLKILG